MGLTAAAEWVVGLPANKGSVTGQSMTTGANYDLVGADNTPTIPVTKKTTLTVSADLTAGAAGDLALQVNPIDAFGVVIPIPLTPVTTVGPTLNAGHSQMTAQYDVTAYDRVRVRITNNNAGTQTLKASYVTS
jgi:hypothetical protein